MIKTIILFSTLFVSNLRQINTNVRDIIYSSHIPNDSKKLFLAITIRETNHTNERAILLNNYSGFRESYCVNKRKHIFKYRLKRFKNLNQYMCFTEGWFKRKHIRNRDLLLKYVKDGKYAHLPKKDLKKYVRDIVNIEKSL